MNKLLIVFLAVCLVTVHAFVKRDTPITEKIAEKNYLEDIQKTFNDITNKLKEQVNPDQIKKNAGDIIETINKQFENVKKQISSIGSEQNLSPNPASSP